MSKPSRVPRRRIPRHTEALAPAASEASGENPWRPRGVPDAHQEGEGSSLRRLHPGDRKAGANRAAANRGETPLGPARDRMKLDEVNNHPQAMFFLSMDPFKGTHEMNKHQTSTLYGSQGNNQLKLTGTVLVFTTISR